LRAAASAFGDSVQRIRFSADPTDYTMVHSSPVIVLVPGQPDPMVVKPDSSAKEIRTVLENALGEVPRRQNASRSAFAILRSAVPKPSVHRS